MNFSSGILKLGCVGGGAKYENFYVALNVYLVSAMQMGAEKEYVQITLKYNCTFTCSTFTINEYSTD